jgi:hypothetical protein
MRDILMTTLVDITNTGVIKGESPERDQMRNWQSVLQVLGLRTQVNVIAGPEVFQLEDLEGLDYGEDYRGQHNVWAMRFCEMDANDIYSVKELREDFNEVPVIVGLEETARFMLPIFFSYGTLKNIHFRYNEHR